MQYRAELILLRMLLLLQTAAALCTTAFAVQRDGIKFNSELTRVLTRDTAFEAVMRVRATR
jgi:hypothetical protein